MVYFQSFRAEDSMGPSEDDGPDVCVAGSEQYTLLSLSDSNQVTAHAEEASLYVN